MQNKISEIIRNGYGSFLDHVIILCRYSQGRLAFRSRSCLFYKDNGNKNNYMNRRNEMEINEQITELQKSKNNNCNNK